MSWGVSNPTLWRGGDSLFSFQSGCLVLSPDLLGGAVSQEGQKVTTYLWRHQKLWGGVRWWGGGVRRGPPRCWCPDPHCRFKKAANFFSFGTHRRKRCPFSSLLSIGTFFLNVWWSFSHKIIVKTFRKEHFFWIFFQRKLWILQQFSPGIRPFDCAQNQEFPGSLQFRGRSIHPCRVWGGWKWWLIFW